MTPVTVEPKVRAILEQVLARELSASLDAAPLRELGLSSLRMIQLLSELESTFQIRIGDEEVDSEHFGSLDQLVRFIEAKVQGS